MGAAYVLVALICAGVAVFALQNGQPTALKFLGWSLDGVPLAGAILVALAAGLIVAGVPLAIARWRWRARCQFLEARVGVLEKAQAEREAALARPPPMPPIRQAS